MFIRDIALTAALATTTAMGAYAASLDSGINVEGKVMEDGAQVQTETTLDTDIREVEGKTQTNIGLETNKQLVADATVKDLGPDDVQGDTAEDEFDRILRRRQSRHRSPHLGWRADRHRDRGPRNR